MKIYNSGRTYPWIISATFQLLLISSISHAQVIETESGKVEFIGLNEWTAPAVVDTLRSMAPDTPLHACAAVLKRDLGFADAAATGYLTDGSLYTVVSVVEQSSASGIRYLDTPTAVISTPLDWDTALRTLDESPVAIYRGIQLYGYFLAETPDTARALANTHPLSNQMEAFWSFLGKHRSPMARDRALWTLTNDRDEAHRTIAAVILTNFSESDLVWWRLLDALRDSSPMVRTAADGALRALLAHRVRKVNWMPATYSIKWFLNGTNLFAFPLVLKLLTETGVSPTLANDLLRDDSHLIVDHVHAEQPAIRDAARQFLVQLHGGREFESPSAMMKWMKSFRQN